jgi:hypothetical protein
MVKAILSTNSEGRQVLRQMKAGEAERKVKEEESKPIMDRTNKVSLVPLLLKLQVINPVMSDPVGLDLLGTRDNMIQGYRGTFFQVGDVALYGSIFVFDGCAVFYLSHSLRCFFFMEGFEC